MESKLQFEEGAESLASGTGLGRQAGGTHRMSAIRREGREGKVRPAPGNAHDRLASRGLLSSRRICDDPFGAIPFSQLPERMLKRSPCVFQACRNLSGPMGPIQNQTLGRDRAASRWSAPGPGRRTRREDHAPSHRPQMSSDRLFLDRVARQHCPSPLHRQGQTTMHPQPFRSKPDISTLQGIGHFYFALTAKISKRFYRDSRYGDSRSASGSVVGIRN